MCIQEHVWQARSIIFWMIAVTFAATGALLRADDGPGDGYRTVKVTSNGKALPVRVLQQSDPFKNVSSPQTSDQYQPERIFSTSSLMANKSFALPTNSLSHRDADFTTTGQNTFVTKAYDLNPDSRSIPNLNTKASFATTSAYSRQAADSDKTYTTSTADGQNRTAMLASSTSADQGRAALLGGPEKSEGLIADPMADKQYLGPAAQHVPDGIVIKENLVLSRMSDLPDRPLTIDEVRNLINHDTKPDTDAKPAEPSKPLNDPDYKPEPLRDTPSPGADDDANDPVPSPGTMATPPAPENAEPLPQP
jgi:hypothetical protein